MHIFLLVSCPSLGCSPEISVYMPYILQGKVGPWKSYLSIYRTSFERNNRSFSSSKLPFGNSDNNSWHNGRNCTGRDRRYVGNIKTSNAIAASSNGDNENDAGKGTNGGTPISRTPCHHSRSRRVSRDCSARFCVSSKARRAAARACSR
jgi:hypothetical protein